MTTRVAHDLCPVLRRAVLEDGITNPWVVLAARAEEDGEVTYRGLHLPCSPCPALLPPRSLMLSKVPSPLWPHSPSLLLHHPCCNCLHELKLPAAPVSVTTMTRSCYTAPGVILWSLLWIHLGGNDWLLFLLKKKNLAFWEKLTCPPPCPYPLNPMCQLLVRSLCRWSLKPLVYIVSFSPGTCLAAG